MIRRLLLALLMATPAFAQVPAPQIGLGGNIGCQGFPCVNSGTLIMASDANRTVTAQESSAFAIKVTSSTSLTATRNLIFPSGKFLVDVENDTTGAQPIQVIGASGTGVTINNGQTVRVWNDGTNFVQVGSSGGITALTGDVTASGTGSVAATLATVNGSPGACGDSTHVCQVTTNGKGLTTAQTAVAIAGGASPAGFGQVQASNAAGSAFAVATPGTIYNALARPPGVDIRSDSQGVAQGSGTSSPALDGQINGFAYRLQSVFGQRFNNYSNAGNQCGDQAYIFSRTAYPYLDGPIQTELVGTNDGGYYAGSANLQLVFQRCYAFLVTHATIPETDLSTFTKYKANAQAATLSNPGDWTFDNTYGQGRAAYTSTAADTATFTVTVPSGGGTIKACYIISDAYTTGTFTIKDGGTLQVDTLAGSSTTWHSNGDGGATIATHSGQTSFPVCGRLTGKSAGSHTIVFTSVAGVMEPLYVAVDPPPSPDNPSAFIAGLAAVNSSTGGNWYTYNSVYNGYVTAAAANGLADGERAYFVDTQAAQAATQTIFVTDAVTTGTTYTAGGGWQSDIGLTYWRTGTPFTKVSSGPTQGQYSVSAGVYTLNAADVNVPIVFNFNYNCGLGTSNALYATNCLTDFVHSNNFGYGVIAASITAKATAVGLNFQGATQDPTRGFFSGFPPESSAFNQTLADWINPAGARNYAFGSMIPGVAWKIAANGGFWGTDFQDGNGVTSFGPSSTAPIATWGYFPSGSFPNNESQFVATVKMVGAAFQAGLSTAGCTFGCQTLYVQPNHIIHGLSGGGTAGDLTSYLPDNYYINSNLATNNSAQLPSPNVHMGSAMKTAGGFNYNLLFDEQVLPTQGTNTATLTWSPGTGCPVGSTCVENASFANMNAMALPAATTINATTVCLSDGTHCPGPGVGVPTIANASGAGTSPGTPTITGTNSAFVITVTTGTTPLSGATLATITFGSGPLSAAPLGCSLTPRNDNAAGVNADFFTTAPSTTAWTIFVGDTPFAASSTFSWYGTCK